MRGYNVNARSILRQQKQVEFNRDANLSEIDTCEMITQTYATYKDIVKDAKENRVTFINNLATAKAKAGRVNVANALKQIIITET